MNILSKRLLIIISFSLAIISAVFLFTVAPKRVAKADEEENEVLATYDYTLISGGTAYEILVIIKAKQPKQTFRANITVCPLRE